MTIAPLLSPLAVVVVGVVAFVFLGAAVREAVRAVALARQRATPIDELAPGETVTISGVARAADGTVRGPFTGRDCLACTWRIAGRRTVRSPGGDARVSEDDVARGRDGVPFLVADDTGSVVVDPGEADLRLGEAWVWGYEPDPAEREDLLSAADAVHGDEGTDPQYFESRLDEGEAVVVRGRVGDAGERVSAGRVGLRIAGGGTFVSDAPPGVAARHALVTALYALGAAVFALAVLAFLTGYVTV